MTTCPNPKCNAKIGCSCKLRKASDGTQVCVNCIMKYEASINQKGTPIVQKTTGTAPTVKSITYNQGK